MKFYLWLIICWAGFFLESFPSVPGVSKNQKHFLKTRDYSLQANILVDRLKHPWGLSWISPNSIEGVKADSGLMMLVSERNGGIWLVEHKKITLIKNLPQDVAAWGQGGWFDLLNIKNDLFLSYAQKIGNRSTTGLIRFRLRKKNHSYEAYGVETIFKMNPALSASVHYGGMLATDQKNIFLGLGDRGNRHLAQDPSSDPGSIISLSLSELASRPFNLSSKTVYSYGHRNIQGLFYDAVRKKLFATEHGPQGGDELNLITRGRNYGWPTISYGKEYGSSQPVSDKTHQTGMEQPIRYWDPSPALSGLMVYQGNLFPKWKGKLFLGSLKHQRVYKLTLKGSSILEEEQIFKYRWGRIRSLREHPVDGTIYLLIDDDPGKIIEITRAE